MSSPRNGITADASKVSATDFLATVLGITPKYREEQARRMREKCIRAIERGDTYGWPPTFVADCRKLMADAQFTETRSDPFLPSEWAA